MPASATHGLGRNQTKPKDDHEITEKTLRNIRVTRWLGSLYFRVINCLAYKT